MMNIMWGLSSMNSPSFYTDTDQNLAGITYGGLPPTGGSLWDGSLPLTKGRYGVTTPGASGWGWINPNSNYGGDVLYSLSFDVAPTPEPASMLLLGTGLAALAGARKLKKQQAA
jgi:hypothetical protein